MSNNSVTPEIIFSVKAGNGRLYNKQLYTSKDVWDKMDWHMLYFGHVTVGERQLYISISEWQQVRLRMKGTTNRFKYEQLCRWLIYCNFSKAAKVQVTNYITALSRGGLIKPTDYR